MELKKTNAYQSLITTVCAIALLLFLIHCALVEVAVLSYAVLVAFFAFAVVATRSKTVVVALAIPAALGFLCMPISSVAYFLSGIGIIAIVAVAIRKGQYLSLLAIPVAYGVCLAIVGDPVFSLGTLTFVPPAIVMGVLLRKDAKRGTLIASTAGCIAILPVITLAALAYGETGTISLSFFTDYVTALRDALIPEMVAMFETAGVANTEQILLAGFNTVIRLLPAILIILCEILAYLASVLGIALVGSGKDSPLPLHTRVLRMETVSAIVFLIALALSLLLQGMQGTAGVVWISAQNLTLILLPGLAIQELLLFVAKLRAGRASIFFPIIFVIFAGFMLPVLLALMGAVRLIRDSRSFHNNNGDGI